MLFSLKWSHRLAGLHQLRLLFLKKREHPCHSVSLTQQLTAQICAEHISTYPLAVCGLNNDAGRHPGTGTGAVAGSRAYLLTRGIKQVARGGGMRWGSGAVGLGGEKLGKPWRMALECWGSSCPATLQKALVPEAIPGTAEGGKREIAWIKYV